MQKGLDLLIKKYAVCDQAAMSEDGRCVLIGGIKYPVLSYEAERRISEIKNVYKSGRVGGPCTYRISHIAERGTDLFELLYREVGILTFTADSCVKEIFAIGGQRAMNCIAVCDSGCVATIELAATLAPGECEIDKHEMICEVGVVCDRVVDTQVPQQSIYVFGENRAAYKDVDAELYGYTEGESAAIRTAFKLASSAEYREESLAKAAHIDAVVAAARKSLETLENVKVGC